MLEIYQEQLSDLLSNAGGGAVSDNPRLQIRQTETVNADGNFGAEVRGLRIIYPETYQDALDLYQSGTRLRRLGTSERNEHSSRSHTVFTIHMRFNHPDTGESLGVSKFNLVDLAGSERQSSTTALDRTRVTEASSINQSLSSLGKVVQACVLRSSARLSEKERGRIHIPYRDSMLTRLLSDSIGGQTRSLIIVHVTPHEQDAQESFRTLQFASGAACVKERAALSNLREDEEPERNGRKMSPDIGVSPSNVSPTRGRGADVSVAMSPKARQLPPAMPGKSPRASSPKGSSSPPPRGYHRSSTALSLLAAFRRGGS